MKRIAPTKPKPRKGRARKGEGTLRLRGNTWWYRIPNPVPGGPMLEGSCKTSDRQQAILAKNRAILAAREPATAKAAEATVGEILDEYYDEKLAENEHKEAEDPEVDAHRNVASLRSSVGRLKRHIGHMLTADVTSDHIMKFREHREKIDRVLFATVNHDLRWLRAAYHRAMRLTPPKATSTPYLWMPSEKSRIRQGFVTRSGQYEEVLKVCPDSLRALWICGFHVGARAGELKRIRWQMVDFARNVIEITPRTAKTGEGRSIPIWGDMIDVLQWQKEVRDRRFPGCPHVFFWHDGPYAGKRIIEHDGAFRKVFDAAGYPDLIFHDLRRSAIRYAIQDAGIDNTIVRHMSGHKTDGNLMRYNISSTREMEKLGRRLDQSLHLVHKKKLA